MAHHIDGMPNEEYHRHPCISKSGLDRIAISPAHYKRGRSTISADVARFGTVFHSMVLEGESPLVAPECGRKAREDRDAWRDWMTRHGADGDAISKLYAAEWLDAFTAATGKQCVTDAESKRLNGMRDAIIANPLARGLLFDSEGIAERSLFVDVEGVPFKARPDRTLTDRPVIADLKSALSAAPREFARACATRRYHVQHAAYSTAHYELTGEWPEFHFVAVEKEPPYSCVVYRLTDEAIENGLYLMRRDLDTYAECMERDEWPGHENNDALSIPIYERETFELDFGDTMLRVA